MQEIKTDWNFDAYMHACEQIIFGLHAWWHVG